MLGPTAERHLGRAAEGALRRLRQDRGSAPVQLVQLFAHLEERLFEQDLSVRSLFSACQLTPAASGVFRRSTGSSPGEYIETLRIETASQLLSDSDLPIWQIAELVGYASPRAFRRAFKRRHGRNPRDLRHGCPQVACYHGAVTRGLSRPFERQVIEHAHAEATWDQLADRELPEQQAIIARHPDLVTPSLFWLVCERSIELSRLDPKIRQPLNQLALTCAESLEPEAKMGNCPLRAIGWAFMGNAYNLVLMRHAAQQAFGEAERFLPPAAMQPTAAGTVAALRASFLWNDRRLQEASDLAASANLLLRRGDRPLLAVRNLLLQAILSFHLDQRREIAFLEEAMDILRRHDNLYERLICLQHLVIYRVDRGQYDQAAGDLEDAKKLCAEVEGGRFFKIHLLWAEGRLWTGRHHLERSIELLQRVQAELYSMEMLREVTLVSLDLAYVHSLNGCTREVLELVEEALRLSKATESSPEHLMALNLLGRAARQQEVSSSLLKKTCKTLRQVTAAN